MSILSQFNSADDNVEKWFVHIFGIYLIIKPRDQMEVEECFTDYFMAENPVNSAITEFYKYISNVSPFSSENVGIAIFEQNTYDKHMSKLSFGFEFIFLSSTSTYF